MLHWPPNPAPEPYATGALWMLYEVALFIRNHANSISEKQLSDLGDAIHNVPWSLTENGPNLNERVIRDIFLASYDKKWAQSPDSFSLVRALDNGIEQATKWRAKHQSV